MCKSNRCGDDFLLQHRGIGPVEDPLKAIELAARNRYTRDLPQYQTSIFPGLGFHRRLTILSSFMGSALVLRSVNINPGGLDRGNVMYVSRFRYGRSC